MLLEKFRNTYRCLCCIIRSFVKSNIRIVLVRLKIYLPRIRNTTLLILLIFASYIHRYYRAKIFPKDLVAFDTIYRTSDSDAKLIFDILPITLLRFRFPTCISPILRFNVSTFKLETLHRNFHRSMRSFVRANRSPRVFRL